MCIGCPIAGLLSELVAKYYSLSVKIPRSSYPAMSRAGFLLCNTVMSLDW